MGAEAEANALAVHLHRETHPSLCMCYLVGTNANKGWSKLAKNFTKTGSPKGHRSNVYYLNKLP